MSTSVTVEVPGPPPVMVYTRSNTWNDQMVPSVTTRNVTLESPGSVILKKRWNALAPSTSAASYRLRGISMMPAK